MVYKMRKFIKENSFAFLLILTISVFKLVISWQDTAYIVNRLVDDAFYYFKTAQNNVNGYGSTFDGLNLTNGYHPLWMLCLLPIYYLISNDGDLVLHIILTLQVLMAALFMFLAYNFISKNLSKSAGIVALLVFLWPRFINQMEYGMEGGGLILLLLMTVLYMHNRGSMRLECSTKENLIFGLLLGLIFLARLDSIFLLAAVAFFILY